VRDPARGQEIDLFTESYPAVYFGFTEVHALPAEDRLLTNGQRLPGSVIVGTDVVMNSGRLAEGLQLLHTYGFSLDLLGTALQVLVAHEVGHAIGLGHPNEDIFYDTDTDPYNEMRIDPRNPFADLIVSSIPLDTPASQLPLMWGGLSSSAPADLLDLVERLYAPGPSFDDLGGRDVLYPVLPETTPTPIATASPTPTLTPTATATPEPCVGDCNLDGSVTVDELVRGVVIALGEAVLSDCTSLDFDSSGGVTVDELVRAVNAALRGCGLA